MFAPGEGVCVVAPGGHAWLLQGGCAWDSTRYGDTVNERAVRILLECILVYLERIQYHTSFAPQKKNQGLQKDLLVSFIGIILFI